MAPDYSAVLRLHPDLPPQIEREKQRGPNWQNTAEIQTPTKR
jgi:hypothetical protein